MTCARSLHAMQTSNVTTQAMYSCKLRIHASYVSRQAMCSGKLHMNASHEIMQAMCPCKLCIHAPVCNVVLAAALKLVAHEVC